MNENISQYLVHMETLHKAEIKKKDEIIKELIHELDLYKNEINTNSIDRTKSAKHLHTEKEILDDLKKIVC